MITILVVEDEQQIRQLYCRVLRQNGYATLEADNGEKALTLLEQHRVDLILSDVMMPDMDGFELVNALRQCGDQVPILLITAKDSFGDLQQGFNSGADDYMTKPVNLQEMLLRIQALLRRSRMNQEQKLTIGSTTLEYNTFTVITGQTAQILPRREFMLLYKLLADCGRAFTKLQLLDDIWGYQSDADPHTVEVHIGRLRHRFADNPDFSIQTIRGMGYRAVRRES